MQSPEFPRKEIGKNPLTGYMRQPKIYIRLPSQGEFWPKKSISIPETGEFPVYSMTARDELLFKTPDALLNGQAVVDVIHSCMPNIKNAWDTPLIDLDTILIAIRLATYGERMSIKHRIPVSNEEIEHDIDLRYLLDSQSQNYWLNQIAIGEDFVVFVKPLTYKHLNQASMKTFETRRILNAVNDDTLTEEKKLEVFNAGFSNLTKITIDLLTDSIYMIETAEDQVTDPKFIREFVNNADKTIFDKINQHITDLKKLNDLKPVKIKSTEEQQAAGVPAEYEIPINFNESDFFGQGF